MGGVNWAGQGWGWIGGEGGLRGVAAWVDAAALRFSRERFLRWHGKQRTGI